MEEGNSVQKTYFCPNVSGDLSLFSCLGLNNIRVTNRINKQKQHELILGKYITTTKLHQHAR